MARKEEFVMRGKLLFCMKLRFHRFTGRLHRWWIKFRMKSSRRRDNLARGLVNDCTKCGPWTEEQKRENHLNKILGNACNPVEAIQHFERLSRESDPLEGTTEIPDNSIKSVHRSDK